MPSFTFDNETYYATPQTQTDNYNLTLEDQNEIVREFQPKTLFGDAVHEMLMKEAAWNAASPGAVGFWWSVFGEDMMAIEEKTQADYRRNRAALEKSSEIDAAAFERRNKAERTAIRVGLACTKHHVAIKKVAQPCKFLYNCQGTPARPTTLGVTTECWSHSYKDPATGKIITKHACDRLHPGEEGWCAQWQTNRNYKPAAPAVREWDQTKRARW